MAGDKNDIDEISGVETTGHEWDGLKELNNPLPRWWLYTMYLTIIWAVLYWIAMPAWPLVSSYTTGLLGSSQREQALAALETGIAERSVGGQGILDASLEDIRSTTAMLEFAMASGRAAFGDNCAPCHGSGATGSPGYPNLQDDVWLWGGSLEDILTTVRYGIRSGHDEARVGDMPAFGRDEILSREEITQVANYVATLSGGAPEEGVDLEAGQTVFADNCAACHGEDGTGLQEMGAPDLTDAIWLYGGSIQEIKLQITNGRNGVMPAWEARLDPVTVKSLAVYVHSLGGGQ
ncbi:cytochrome-c oxidase, cbb3-type subunit III [Breoghania sp. L-A4]|uniref:cytochrome-c oxidase, cbb3-type subunit III n=1 Tax=Breoghania sp. L-A4 TaxID=2304600 RepID=UPI000E35C6AF|nr:cytochrome-c oxidase, cbb3-type subunit III [Breoghania sp. L-A4]AXS39675.1 cytochrome-c oxidase, cbb3-type subunit III [Breoghania sp. L-A4]